MKKKRKIITNYLPSILAVFFLAVSLAYAWTEPSVAPPNGNISAPLNVSSNIQTKAGQLKINTADPDVTYGLVVGIPAGGNAIKSNGNIWLNSATAFLLTGTRITESLIGDTVWQKRVSGTCAAGSSIRVINTDGTVSCETDDVSAGSIPAGIITMWSGALVNIPGGWDLADGSVCGATALGTPDLRDKFILGTSAAENPGATGGSNSITLTVNQIPAHNHTGSTNSAGSHSHSGTTDTGGGHSHTGSSSNETVTHNHSYIKTDHVLTTIRQPLLAVLGNFTYVSDLTGASTDTTNQSIRHNHDITINFANAHTHAFNTSSSGSHSHTLSIDNTGGGQSFDNRPAFYKLAFIMKCN